MVLQEPLGMTESLQLVHYRKKKELKNLDRGSFASCIDSDHGIFFIKWVDNNVVAAASTTYGAAPVGTVRRYSKKENKYVQIARPQIIAKYNNNMGGTDLMDQNISTYRVGIRSKKWWWCIFTWLIDASISNSWILYKHYYPKISQLDFRRCIAQSYLKKYSNAPKHGGRPSSSKFSVSLNRISDDLRYDGNNHLLISIPNNKRRRCTGEGCISSTRTMCSKCDVGMCIDCNYTFHMKTF